ncbi:MAG TPA: efflux RND transporter periplasmic adaptor subunit [Accumulibacter sp.]|uniref:efflux RND transporter periplasmic adaptor subunit n=1 Tax=Accumulibacter sp. TaxID=2053492 RepID=UPI002B90CDA1|nr:efflux RND transporter periplasmic adaptor subunit [Accumulibacter sp.]HRF72526.1 efflux RND transporter periplasmic adaptor subunit [Accumulibacter sp.]
MSSRTNRFLVLAVAIVGLAVLGYLAFRGFRQPGSPTILAAPAGGASKPGAAATAGPPGGMAVPVETARVSASELAVDATAVGSLRSNESVVLRPEIAGRIASINFKDGASVGKGSLLVALDAATQAAELDQARASLALAEANYQRTRDLFAKKFISGQALDNAQAALKVQDASLALAQARLDKTRLRAPFAGVLGIRNVSVGDYVKEGQELVNLEDIATLKVDFRLPESYLGQLEPGQRLEVSSDALPGQVFTAVLEAINPLVEASGRAISLRASLPNSERRLRPGMFVRVRLIFERRSGVLLIPEQAVVPDSQTPYVYRVVDGQAKRSPIKTGLRRDGQVEVTEGLHAGDEIVTAGQLKLRDGTPVQAVGGVAPGGASVAGAGGPAK